MKNAPTKLQPLAEVAAYKHATEALARLANKRSELISEQRALEKRLREPVVETVGFVARTAALLTGAPVREDHAALRERHLEVRQAIEAIDQTARLGRAELQSLEAEARVAALKAIDPAHRELCRQSAELLDQLLQVAKAEQALLAEAGVAGYPDLALQVRVLPWQIADALDADSLVQRHLRELKTQ